ncbi:MAG: hypothetical protein IT385_15840 [Deltaproteobacteria bacterium]|nr:hypothetical protein [Deltaproteobacteria bacterium]
MGSICALLVPVVGCGDDDGGGQDTSVATETASTETAITETTITETSVTETAVTETTITETTITETAVADSDDGDDDSDAQATELVEDVAVPPVCMGRAADRAEGLYDATGALVAACDADERCNVDGDACVEARCFPAESGSPEGVYELDGEARGQRLERCDAGYRCDDDGTPYCERTPGVGLPVGFACAGDLECAGIDGFEGRCIDDAGGFAMEAGRCGHGCGAQGDCPSGSHCAYLDSDDPVCLADCPAFVPCPTGASCQDGDDDGRDECVPVGALPTDVGAACATVEDCAGDPASGTLCVLDALFWLGGYCVDLGCLVDADCPEDSHCGFFGGAGAAGACIADCGAGDTCARDDHTCRDFDSDGRDECGPRATGDGAIGAPCGSFADCAGGPEGVCWFEQDSGVAGGYCAMNCALDGDCPDGSVCALRGPSGRGLCLTACEDAGDCLATQACFDRDFDGRPECGRPGDGATAQNGACTRHVECGTGPRGLCLGGVNFGGGLCTADCLGDDDCDGASHCALAEGRGSGFCLPDCTAGDTCPSGTGCGDFDRDGRGECGPAPAGTIALGDTCAAASECAPGDGVFCAYPDLVCTRFCTADADCGIGNRCAEVELDTNKVCRKGCVSDAQCSAGLTCTDIDGSGAKECVGVGFGNNPVGAECGASAVCDRSADLVCRGDVPRGMCTRGCSDTAACPGGSRCAALPGIDGELCVATCATDADCRQDAGWACFDGDGDGAKECLPYGGGDGAIGDVCRVAPDCAGGEDARCVVRPATFFGVCSMSCADDAACGSGGSCVPVPMEPSSVCLAACSGDDDCVGPLTCSDVGGTSTTECALTCAADADCSQFRGAHVCNDDGLCAPE